MRYFIDSDKIKATWRFSIFGLKTINLQKTFYTEILMGCLPSEKQRLKIERVYIYEDLHLEIYRMGKLCHTGIDNNTDEC